MAYKAEVSRRNPSSFVMLIDQSRSMNEPLAGAQQPMTKAAAVADAVNSLLQSLVLKCTKAEGIRDYYHLAVIGYGGSGVRSIFTAQLSQNNFTPIGVIGNTPARIETVIRRVSDGRGGFAERPYNKPIWIEPAADGGTPLCAALERATSILRVWLNQHPDCFPPIVINISDGESSDGNPKAAAAGLTSLTSSDGQVLLFNIHLSSSSSRRVVYPYSDDQLEDDYSRDLFAISSALTPYMQNMLAGEGFAVRTNSKGMAVHADFATLLQFLDIGTRPANFT